MGAERKWIERDGTNITVRGPLALVVMPIFALVGIVVLCLSLLVAGAVMVGCAIVSPIIWLAEQSFKLGRKQ